MGTIRAMLRPRWLLTIMASLAFACVLFANGLVNSEFGADGDAAPPGSSAAVPAGVQDGGPILGPQQRQFHVPDKTVILTFDDGPDPEWTPQILDVLERHHVPATFYVVGSAVTKHPEIVKRMQRDGHEIGLHTFMHVDLSTVPDWRFGMELSESQLAVAGATGVTSSLVRPPYSSTTDAIDDNQWRALKALGDDGYTTVLTTLDSRDWERPPIDKIVENATPRSDKGEIILLHDAGGDRSRTVTALDKLIPLLHDKGYRFATTAQVIGETSANPAAASGEHWRGVALVGIVKVASRIVDALALILLVAGVLMVTRLVLMWVVASRHARNRRPGRWSWGRPVTEPVTVIVPAYNERECIADTIRSLVRGTHPVEVIVVDDGSTDGTADVAESLGLPGVRVIRKPNGGKPSALNTGIAAARCDLIVMMDGDTVFTRDTVQRLIQPFGDPRVGAVAGNAKIANKNTMLGRWQHIEYVIGSNIDRRVYDVLRCMPTVPGAIGAFRRSALMRVGGISDDTLAEDTDLTISIIRDGWWVVFEPSAVAYTEAPVKVGQLWRQRYRWSYGTMQAMWKHRRAVIERGPSGRFGRWGLAHLAVFQITLPLLAPLVDVLLVYGLMFLDPVKTLAFWTAVLAVQFAGAFYAFRLDREPLRALWALPVQQIFYRQLMYTVLIHSMISALGGIRLGWHKLQRTGGLDALVNQNARS